jgi:hypothetical protein
MSCKLSSLLLLPLPSTYIQFSEIWNTTLIHEMNPTTMRDRMPPKQVASIRPLARPPLLSTIEEEVPKPADFMYNYDRLSASFS